MHRLALIVTALALGSTAAHAAATQWVPTCSTKDENTVWFVLSTNPPVDDKAKKDEKKDEKKDAAAAGGAAAGGAANAAGASTVPWTANPDFSCTGLFFDNVACTNAIVIGKIMQVGLKVLEPVFELRYVPAGETANILSFLDRTGPNVLYDARNVPPSSSPPSREALFQGWLEKWHMASGQTQGVTIHLWICPEGDFSPPDELINGWGMSVTPHFGRAPT